VRLSPEQAVDLEFRGSRPKSRIPQACPRRTCFPTRPLGPRKYTCGGGQNGCAIDPGGRMTICVISHHDDYNLRDTSFAEGFGRRLSRYSRDATHAPNHLFALSDPTLCGMCPPTVNSKSGDAKPPWIFSARLLICAPTPRGLRARAWRLSLLFFRRPFYSHLQNRRKRLQESSSNIEKD